MVRNALAKTSTRRAAMRTPPWRDVAKITEKFGRRAEDVVRAISDATELAKRLNQASVRVDGILVKVDNLLGSGETRVWRRRRPIR